MNTVLAREETQPRPISSPAPLLLRYVQVLLFVGVWAGLGVGLRLDANAYLLIGVPLTLGFQVLIRRRPLRELWVRDGAAFRLGRAGVIVALGLVVVPGMFLVDALRHHKWIPAVWAMAAVVGAVAAAFSVTRFTRATVRQLLLCLATAGTAGVVMMGGAAIARSVVLHQAIHPSAMAGVESLLVYFPVTFVLEEVTFRGVIDAHLQPSSGRWTSALFVSALWGLWHWPVVPEAGWATALQLIVVHTIIGVPLSIFWRRSGNLAVPGFTHAFIDAVRNALLSG
jgi:membrane protease YdiL (CAAX protease family)